MRAWMRRLIWRFVALAPALQSVVLVVVYGMRLEPSAGPQKTNESSAPVAPVALSLVLPCYRSAALARESVLRLSGAMISRIPSYEIIVVDDGGGDCNAA